MDFEKIMGGFRKELKELGKKINDVKFDYQNCPKAEEENPGEIMANLTLAYRHIEDASMRCGKVIQHSQGGVSQYDKNVVGSPE